MTPKHAPLRSSINNESMLNRIFALYPYTIDRSSPQQSALRLIAKLLHLIMVYYRMQIAIYDLSLQIDRYSLLMINLSIFRYIRYGRIPLRLIAKLLLFYNDTTNIDAMFELFEVMKRFRSWSLQHINNMDNIEDNNNFWFSYWDSQIFRDDILPLFIKIIFDYFYSLCIDKRNVSESVLIAYIFNAQNICKYINYNTNNTPSASIYLCGIHYLSGNINIANKLIMNVIYKYLNINNNTNDINNEYLLLSQWQNGQFVLNLSPTKNIPNIMYSPLILSSLIFYSKLIPKQNKSLKSIKIKIDIHKLDEIEKLFNYLTINYPPKIEYQIIAKIPNWIIVVDLELNTLLKWVEYHNMISFHDINKSKMLEKTCYDLIPRIITSEMLQNKPRDIQITKQWFKDMNRTLNK